jgi:hypothetical protein
MVNGDIMSYPKLLGELIAALQRKFVEAGLDHATARSAVEYIVFDRMHLTRVKLEQTLRRFMSDDWTAADCLLVGFSWGVSPEGSFWDVLYKELS